MSNGQPAEPSGPNGAPEADASTATGSTPPPGAAPTDGHGPTEEKTVGELVFEISDRASVLVREEIELAKTEVTEKVNQLLRGSVVAIAAGVFVLMALAMLMHGIAWLLNDLVFDNDWTGFLIEAVLFLLVAAGAGLFAYRAFQSASPPTPDLAIEQAKEIRDEVMEGVDQTARDEGPAGETTETAEETTETKETAT